MSAKGIYSVYLYNIMNGWPTITGEVILDVRANKKFIYDTASNKDINTSFKHEPIKTANKGYHKLAGTTFTDTIKLYETNYTNAVSLDPIIKFGYKSDTRNFFQNNNFTAYSWIYINGYDTIYPTKGLVSGDAIFCVDIQISDRANPPKTYRQYICANNHMEPSYISYRYADASMTRQGEALSGLKNKWTNFVITRSGNTTYFFINGTLTHTFNVSSYNFTEPYLSQFEVGSWQDPVDIYIYNAVIIKNQALWTSNFTPPTGYLDTPKFKNSMIIKANNNLSDIELY